MPLPNMDQLRASATGAIEMASGKLQEAKIGEKLKEAKIGEKLRETKFKLMRTSESEAELVEEDTSQASESTSSSRLEELSAFCPKLTWQQRLIGFSVSFGVGYLITFMSFKFFIELVEGRPVPFALNYSFGNVLSLSSMTFLCGPAKQFKNMFDEKRKFTSITYLSCLVATIACVFIPFPGSLRLVLLISFVFAQFCACVWYSLSYIPFGRRWALKCIKRQLGMTENAEWNLGGSFGSGSGSASQSG